MNEVKNDIIQTKCRSCYSEELKDILSLGDLYLSDFTSEHTLPPKFPLILLYCKVCSLVQLKHNVPPTLLYSENYGYRSGINETMRNELQEISKKALKYFNYEKNLISVLDIGANDGTLLSFYPQNIDKVGVEPIKKLAKMCRRFAPIVINDFFSYEKVNEQIKNKKFNIITIISCFYDMLDPNSFVKDLTSLLDDSGIIVIQQNYLPSMIKQNAFDNIVHEHVEYYSLLSLSHLLSKYNLEIFRVEQNNLNGGSFRTYIGFKGKHPISPSVKKMAKAEHKQKLTDEKIYHLFAKRVEKNKKIIHDFISNEVKNGKKVYIYGASTRGNTLLQYFNLNKSLIPFAVERNEEKWGKIIASVNIPIISEEKARKDKPNYMLVLPWFFKKEFLIREKKYLNSGGHFIFPLPKMHIV